MLHWFFILLANAQLMVNPGKCNAMFGVSGRKQKEMRLGISWL